MNQKTNTKTNTKKNNNINNNWYANPDPGHLVQFYPDDNTLIDNLHEYVSTGLGSKATCLVIATKTHIAKLDARLGQTIDVAAAQASGRYITFNARQALASFMVDDMPDEKLFYKHIGSLMQEVIQKHGKPVRAYGEMVAILWKAGNKDAVIELEQLWNGLAEEYDFSLYCAYPELHFVMDCEARAEISRCHNLHAQSFAN